MPELELATRLVISAEAALVSTLLIGAWRANRTYLASAALFLCLMGYMMAPVLLQYSGTAALAYAAVLLAVLAPTALWYLACTIFRDNFSPSAYALVLVAATGVLGMAGFLTGPRLAMDWIDWASQAVKLGWVAAAFTVATRDWRTDLVEPRRQVRRILVLLTGIYMIAIMAVEVMIPGEIPPGVELLNVLLILVLVSTVVVHLLAIDRDNILTRIVRAEAPVVGDQSPLAREVLKLMEDDRTYAMEGLTLGTLARQLGTQSHVLRKVINNELGHRNFNSFINLYRVREVAERLETPEYENTPLLTLALDAGFRSLAPFNRTFRDHFGVTPSAYRSSLATKKQ